MQRSIDQKRGKKEPVTEKRRTPVLNFRPEVARVLRLATLVTFGAASCMCLILAIAYSTTLKVAQERDARLMTELQLDTFRLAHELLDPVASSIRVVSEMAALDPGLFQREESKNILYKALTSAPHIDAVYATFESGFHRVVTRIDDDRRRSDPKIPVIANWHSSWVDAFQDGGKRQRHRSFYGSWPEVVSRYNVDEKVDQRAALWQYKEAKKTGSLAISGPIINPDSGYPVIALGYPIASGSVFSGVVSAHITLDQLSEFLQSRRLSDRSTTVIVDDDGTIIAHPEMSKTVMNTDGKIAPSSIRTISSAPLERAFDLRERNEGRQFVFRLEHNSEDYVAAYSRLPDAFGKPWNVLAVAPISDLASPLKDEYGRLLLPLLLISLLSGGAFYLVARYIVK